MNEAITVVIPRRRKKPLPARLFGRAGSFTYVPERKVHAFGQYAPGQKVSYMKRLVSLAGVVQASCMSRDAYGVPFELVTVRIPGSVRTVLCANFQGGLVHVPKG